MSIMKNPVFLSCLGSLIGILILYLHNKITKKKHDRKEYIKLLLILFIVSFIIIHIYMYSENDSFNNINTDMEIYTGQPDF